MNRHKEGCPVFAVPACDCPVGDDHITQAGFDREAEKDRRIAELEARPNAEQERAGRFLLALKAIAGSETKDADVLRQIAKDAEYADLARANQ